MLAVIESRKSWAAGLACSLLAAAGMTALAQSSGDAVPAKRLTLHYSGASATLKVKPSTDATKASETSFTKVLPPSDQLPEGKGPFCGFWYELQDGKGVVKYRRIIGNPIRPPGSTAPATEEKVFSVVIPAPAAGDQLVIFSSPLVPGGESQPAEVISRITLTTTN